MLSDSLSIKRLFSFILTSNNELASSIIDCSRPSLAEIFIALDFPGKPIINL